MKASVIKLLDEAQKKMSGYAALFNYQLHNLSIKAEPEALLSISVDLDEDEVPIEKVARARNAEGRDDQFEIFPLAQDLLFYVVKGIKESHPEYDLDIRDVDDGEEMEEDEGKDQYILATMPVVDDDRHDVLTDAVDTLTNGCKAMMDATLTYYTTQVSLILAGSPPEELDEVKDALKEMFDTADGLCQQFHDGKMKEIEDAYQHYLAKKAEQEAKEQEEQAAHNEQAGLQMKWNQDDDE